jgi:hypothetical protein
MLDGTFLDGVNSINDLGVIMEEKITFSEHVDVMDSLHVSGSSKTGIRKLGVEPVL